MRLLDLNRSKLGSLLAISIILFSLLGSVENSKAYATHNVIKGNIITNTQKVSCRLTNGKFAYVTVDSTTKKVNITVYNPSGLDGTSSYLNSLTLKDFSVIAVNDTVIVFYQTFSSPNIYMNVLKLNTTTYALTYLNMGNIGATAYVQSTVSTLLYYNGYVFGFAWVEGSTPINWCYRYKISYNTYNYVALSYVMKGYIYGFQLEDNPQLSYWMASDPSDYTKPIYIAWDLSAYSTSVEVLATHPFNDDLYFSAYTRFLGGGVYVDGAGKYYLYYNWAITDDEFIEVIQHRLRFSSGGISTANLEDQHRGVDTIFTTHFEIVSPSDTNIPCGFVTSKEDFTVYYADYHPSSDTLFCTKQHFEITSNWTDFTTECTTTKTATEASSLEIMNNMLWENRAWKDPLGSWEIMEDWVDLDAAYIYYGFLPSERVYALTYSYIPVGDLYTSTQYLWTLTLTMNGVIEPGASIIIKFDNMTLSTKQTNIYGLCDFTMLTTISGYHEIAFWVYEYSEYQDTFTEDLIFYTLAGEGEGVGLIDTTMQGLYTLIPIFLVVLIPAFLIASFLGVFGFVIGLIIGGVTGTVSGILPASAFLLIVLVVAVFLVLVFRPKGGGGGP